MGPSVVRLGVHADASASRIELAVPQESWTAEDESTWSVDPRGELARDVTALVGAPVRAERLRWRDLEVALDGGPGATDRSEDDLAWLAGERLFVRQAHAPPDASVVWRLPPPRREVDCRTGRPDARRITVDRTTADGFRVGTGGDLAFDLELDEGDRLHFALVHRPHREPASLRVLVGDEVAFEREAQDGAYATQHVVPLPRATAPDAPLRFVVVGEPSVANVLVPRVERVSVESDEDALDVVLFSADTFRRDNLGSSAPSITPNLDRLAARSARFERAWATTPWTLPSHTSMFLGLHPHEHGAVTGGRRASPAFVSIAEHFAAAGFRTAAVTDGSWLSPPHGFADGFEWFETHSERRVPLTARRALELLDADDGRPLFLFVHSYRVHMPYHWSGETERRLDDAIDFQRALAICAAVVAATGRVGAAEDDAGEPPGNPMQVLLRRKNWRAAHERVLPTLVENGVVSAEHGLDEIAASVRDLYAGGVATFDDELGRFLDAMDARNAWSHTAFVFTSDHGEAFGEHGHFFHRAGLPFEELIGVPLLVRAPGVEPGPREVPASIVDLPRTLSSLAGLPPWPDWRGIALLDGDGERSTPVLGFNASETDPVVAFLDGRWKVMVQRAELERDEPRILGLYDLEADPGEEHNLVEERGEKASELVERWRDELVRATTPRRDVERVAVGDDQERELRALGYLGD